MDKIQAENQAILNRLTSELQFNLQLQTQLILLQNELEVLGNSKEDTKVQE